MVATMRDPATSTGRAAEKSTGEAEARTRYGLTADAASRFISIGANGIGYDAFSVYPSDPGTIAYDGSNHGNGVINLGLMDADPGTSLPAKESVSFPTAGTYTYICTVHGPSMHGTVTVS